MQLNDEITQKILEENLAGNYIASPEGEILYANQVFADSFGFNSIDEVIGFDLRTFYKNHADWSWMKATLKEKKVIRNEKRHLLRKNGSEIIIVENIFGEFDDNGELIKIFGFIFDITDYEAALLKAERINKLKDQFLTNISHEVRTPLVSILGFLEIIERRFKNELGVKDREYFEVIRNSSNRLTKTVNEILDISQIQAGFIHTKPQVTRIATSIEWVYNECSPLAKEKNLDFSFTNKAGDATAYIDEPTILKALTNLVDNAINFTNSGEVSLVLEEIEQYYILTIKDTGIGMSPEYLSGLFDTFSQESSGYAKRYQGLGLGLSIAKRYLDINDVTIDVESEKGTGTTIYLRFVPSDYSKEETELQTGGETKEPTTVEIPPDRKPVVLHVEDDIYNQKTVSIFLKPHVDTCSAVSVDEAKKLLLFRDDIDLVLLDLSLQGEKDGLELVRYIRNSDKHKQLPIIAVTAHTLPQDKDICIAVGCNNFLAKPFNMVKLQKAVRQYITW